MGATVFNQARCFSTQTDAGVFYLWEENTHCIKDGPSQASWCVMAAGNRQRILERIYLCAGSIPGGMLKTRQSATAWVDSMIKLLDNPLMLREGYVPTTKNNKNNMYAAITDHNRVEVKAHLRAMGRDDLADKISDDGKGENGYAQTVVFDLKTDAAVIDAILNKIEYDGNDINGKPCRRKGVAAWTVFDHLSAGIGPGPVEMPNSAFELARPIKPRVQVFSTEFDRRYPGSPEPDFLKIVKVEGIEPIFACGSKHGDYEAKATLVGHAGTIHLKTGQNVLRHLFKAYAAANDSPVRLDSKATTVTITKRPDAWYEKDFKAALAVLGLPDETVEITLSLGGLEAKSGELRNLIDYILNGTLCVFDGPQLSAKA